MTKSKNSDSKNHFNIIKSQELNKINLLAIEYFNYEKHEHFAYNCKFSLKIDKYINFTNKEK